MSAPKVRIQFPKDFSEDQVIKALEATVHQMKGGVQHFEQDHESENNIKEISKHNSATAQLMLVIDKNYDIMMKSLYTEINKVLNAEN